MTLYLLVRIERDLKKSKIRYKKFELAEYFRIFEFVDDKELISLYLNSSW